MNEFYLALKLMTEPRPTWPVAAPVEAIRPVAAPVEAIRPPSARLQKAVRRFEPTGELVAVQLSDGRVLYVPEEK
jgi:hypothetical protein